MHALDNLCCTCNDCLQSCPVVLSNKVRMCTMWQVWNTLCTLQYANVEHIVHVVTLSQLKQIIFDMHSNAKQMHGTLCLNGFVFTTLAAYCATVHCSVGRICTDSYAGDGTVH